MPEILACTEALVTIPELSNTAIVTDGRFSGATRGPCVGHVSPEAARGGPIALVEDGDLICIDIPKRALTAVGTAGKRRNAAEMEKLMEERGKTWTLPRLQHPRGVLKRYATQAASAMLGAYLDG